MYHDITSFYKSSEWRNLRKAIIAERTKDGIIYDEYTRKPLEGTPILHHCIELNEENIYDPNIALNPEHIMIVSMDSHNKIHDRFRKNYRPDQKVYIVYGSPRAGKNTYVETHANDSDLICDIDEIWNCLCLGGRDKKPDRLKSNVFAVRDTIIDQIKKRKGKWNNAWIIGGFALSSDRERLVKLLNAELVFIDTDINTCLKRASNENERQWILEWFETYNR